MRGKGNFSEEKFPFPRAPNLSKDFYYRGSSGKFAEIYKDFPLR